jgi:hypothetical protein
MMRNRQDRRTVTRICVLLCMFVALFTFSSAGTVVSSDEPGMGTLAGTVVGANGKLAAGARVTLQDAGASHPDVTLTNSQGRFFFAELHHGYYDVRAYSNGAWSDWKHNIEVKTGKQTEVRLQVAVKPKKAA